MPRNRSDERDDDLDPRPRRARRKQEDDDEVIDDVEVEEANSRRSRPQPESESTPRKRRSIPSSEDRDDSIRRRLERRQRERIEDDVEEERPRRRPRRRTTPDLDEIQPEDFTTGRIPKSRTYCHENCGETIVSDDSFSHISDPFRICTGTYCCSCRDHVPLSSVYWVDTGEYVSDYRRRVRAAAPAIIKIWRMALGWLCGAIVGGLVGWLIYEMSSKVNQSAAVYIASCAVGGAIIINFIGAYIIEKSLGVDYRRIR